MQPYVPFRGFSNSSTPINREINTTIFSSNAHISLSKYRIFRFNESNSSISESCTCKLFSNNKHCNCETKDGQCFQVNGWMKMLYQLKERKRLQTVYENYENKSKKEVSVLEAEIRKDVAEVTKLWGLTSLSEELVRLLLNFTVHCTYYRRTIYLKIYAFLAAAIIYHCEPYQAFWILDAITQEMDFLNKTPQYVQNVYRYAIQFLKEKIINIERQDVDMRSVIAYLMNDLLCSYTQIEYMGYNIESLLVNGWKHVQQLILSYLDKRIQALEKAGTEGKDLIYTALLNNDVQWPLIFFNMESFSKLD